MAVSTGLLGIFCGLISAVIWGSGDFSGGQAARRSTLFQVLALSSLSGVAILLACALLWREAFPTAPGLMFAALAGVSGSVGLAALYYALSQGHTAIVAPTSAVIGAALPVGFGMFSHGLPPASRLAGFGLAFVGIWLVSQSALPGGAVSKRAFLLGCLAGLGFGGFFILIAQTDPSAVFTPLVVARSVYLFIALLLLRINRQSLLRLTANPIALLAGVLDATGNVFYLLARQFTSLEVAAILSSLYPAATVLLAWLLLKEKVTRTQWLGLVVCLAATGLITV
jgi:drug/metabolite transporter (DMT)-like permease